ncbi:hypothetical protein ACFXJ8_32610 [Nonomuraea sp. NPDC059194]|uniref:hypothetical protein n=1 Tax=Nonomuraea sp. NPDC059194 TaxID=3346764 RepID=UPI0036BF2C07
MDSESRAVAGLLAAMSRAAAAFDELRHPFLRREPMTYFQPGGWTTGVLFTLPDGRMVRFAVSFTHSEQFFHVNGEATVEERALIELPVRRAESVHEALSMLESQTAEVVSPARWLLEQLMEEATEI